MRARTTTSLPKGKTMDCYDVPKTIIPMERKYNIPIERKSKWQDELEQVKRWLQSGERIVQVPEGTTQTNWINQLRMYLGINGEVPTICRIGDTELYVRLIGE
jgi:hypothetical protein